MWKDIPNWEKLYEVNENGEVRNKKTQKLITGFINNGGYSRVCLYNKEFKQKFYRHRLVAELFVPNPNNLPEVNHIDGNKQNNNKENLEWCSRIHNEREAHRLKIKEYKPFEVIFNNNIKKEYEFIVDLAKEIVVTKRTVQNWLQKKNKGYLKKGIIYINYVSSK